MKPWKVGDFIRATSTKNTGEVFWIGFGVQLVEYGKLWQQPGGIKIVYLHKIIGSSGAAPFNRNINGNGKILHKFKPDKNQILEIRKAVEDCYERNQIDNLSYILAIFNLKKYEKKFYKIKNKKTI